MGKDRIGLFGGTFNPVHSGHIHAAEIVRARFSLDKVLFIPSYLPPHKNSRKVAEAGDRLRMVELACQEHASFEASPIEVEAGEKSYSVVTLKRISRLHPQARLFFILGVDAFLEIETWRNYEEILRGCQWIVMSRPRFSLESAGAVLAGKLKDKIRRVEKSDKINDDVLERFGIFLIEIEALDISSTDIRRRILRGESLEGLLPAAVEAYIQEKGLYHDRS